MNTILKRINLCLLIAMIVLIVSGLIFMANGKENLSNDILFIAAITFPFSLAAKGIEFMIDNQLLKAFLSILLLSLVCMLSIIFVFA
ncbi:MAG: hypothetical protein WC384_15445 [Prolixibacteraceae bacterium]